MHEYVHGWCRDHVGIVKINDKEGFGMNLNPVGFGFCFILFYFVLNDKYGKTWLSVQFTCLWYYVLFSILEFFRAWELNCILHAFLLTLGCLYNLSFHAVDRSIVLHCCWTECVVSLFGLFWELYFFFPVINNFANDNIVSLNRDEFARRDMVALVKAVEVTMSPRVRTGHQ